jgi:hypothetical protein
MLGEKVPNVPRRRQKRQNRHNDIFEDERAGVRTMIQILHLGMLFERERLV